MRGLRALPLALLFLLPAAARSDAAPGGQMTWGVHVTLAARWLDPAEAAFAYSAPYEDLKLRR